MSDAPGECAAARHCFQLAACNTSLPPPLCGAPRAHMCARAGGERAGALARASGPPPERPARAAAAEAGLAAEPRALGGVRRGLPAPGRLSLVPRAPAAPGAVDTAAAASGSRGRGVARPRARRSRDQRRGGHHRHAAQPRAGAAAGQLPARAARAGRGAALREVPQQGHAAVRRADVRAPRSRPLACSPARGVALAAGGP